MRILLLACIAGLVAFGETWPVRAEEPVDALRRAVRFYHHQVASHGGYVYRYSEDLAKREGEGKTDKDTVWVQPPGTPAVGLAYVNAYELTGDKELLEAAQDAGECLLRGQLRSGGWTDRIEFAEDRRGKFSYRVDPPRKRGFNVTTFDDDKTQSALRFLARLDQCLKFENKSIHEAVTFALDSVLKAQFPNGAWAQGFSQFPEPDKFPVMKAQYPSDWPRKYPGGDYWDFYTFNDNSIVDTIETLLLASRIYEEPRYREAALKAADFILLAQMPEPQPAWAQQYDFEMRPMWARKFEPPAISGSESQGILRCLMRIYAETEDRKYLEPIQPAIAYLRRSALPDGRLSRFYELKTNRPLYMTRSYELTYDDSDLPTHYGFQVGSDVESLSKQYDRVVKDPKRELAKYRVRSEKPKAEVPSERQVRSIIDALDERGAWVEDGKLKYHGKGDDTRRIVDSATFARNLEILARWIAADSSEKGS